MRDKVYHAFLWSRVLFVNCTYCDDREGSAPFDEAGKSLRLLFILTQTYIKQQIFMRVAFIVLLSALTCMGPVTTYAKKKKG